MKLLGGLCFLGWLLGSFMYALYLVYKLFRAPVVYPWWKRVLLLASSIGMYYVLFFADQVYGVLSILPGSFGDSDFLVTLYGLFLSMVYGLPILLVLGLLWCFNLLRAPPVLILYCSFFIGFAAPYLMVYFVLSS